VAFEGGPFFVMLCCVGGESLGFGHVEVERERDEGCLVWWLRGWCWRGAD
jgi:hypothetical protein